MWVTIESCGNICDLAQMSVVMQCLHGNSQKLIGIAWDRNDLTPSSQYIYDGLSNIYVNTKSKRIVIWTVSSLCANDNREWGICDQNNKNLVCDNTQATYLTEAKIGTAPT